VGLAPALEGLVVGVRDGLALHFLLLLHFSLEEKNQHLTQSEKSSEYIVLRLTARTAE
jgi:hypothetical protein